MTPYGAASGPDNVYCRGVIRDETAHIGLVAFGPLAQRLSDSLVRDNVYDLSDFNVRHARGKFQQPGDHRFELHMTTRSIIQRVSGPPPAAPVTPTAIDALVQDSPVPLFIGIVLNTTTVGSTRTATVCTVADRSQRSINVALWGAHALHTIAAGDMIRVVNGTVRDYQARLEVHATHFTEISINDPADTSHALRATYESGNLTAIRPAGFINFATIENLTAVATNAYASVRACVQSIHTLNITYQACSGPGCNRKVSEGSLLCKAGCVNSTAQWRYCANVLLIDDTGEHKAAIFGSVMERLLGTSAAAFQQLRNTSTTDSMKLLESIDNRRLIVVVRVRSSQVCASIAFSAHIIR